MMWPTVRRAAQTLRSHWRALVAVVALGTLLFGVGVADTLSLIRGLDVIWFGGYVVGALALPFAYGVQVWVVLRLTGYQLDCASVVVAAVNAWSIGQFTPMRAGDLSLAGFIGPGVPRGLVVGVVGIDKIFSVAALAGAFFAAGTALGLQAIVPVAAMVVTVITCLTLPIVAILLLTRLPVPPRAAQGTVMRIFGSARSTVERFVNHPAAIVLIATAAMMRWMIIFVLVWMLFRALGFVPHLIYVVAASAVGRLIALIPISIGGIGLKEPLQIVIYGLDGIPAEAVIAASMLGATVSLIAAGTMPLVMQKLGIGSREAD